MTDGEVSAARKETWQVLCRYVTDTLIFINIMRGFCQNMLEWELGRETELNMMKDMKKRADSINQDLCSVTKQVFKGKGKALEEYLKNKVIGDSRRTELQAELEAVVKDTLVGLEKLDSFLDSVEKLAVTSLHVFADNQVLRLPEGMDWRSAQVVMNAARLISPLLLLFKRDAQAFFLPKLQNLEVMCYQLDKYIQTTQTICKSFTKSSLCDFDIKLKMSTNVDFNLDLCEEELRRMHDHINQLHEIRMDEHFRTVFLFQEETCGDFLSDFRKLQPRMQQFLIDLEMNAVQLDKMDKGAKISSVAGSSVGAVGGVLSIVGLALIPVTAGVSLGLTLAGFGLGITSGLTSAVTTVTETAVNVSQKKEANQTFKSFMEDVCCIQESLDKVTNQVEGRMDGNIEGMIVIGVGKAAKKVGNVVKQINGLVDAVSAFKLLKSEEVVSGIAESISPAAAKGPLAHTKSARAGFIVLNALFLGMDIFFICNDSVNLAKGTKTELSNFIRARAGLWSSEMDAWQRIHGSLCEGRETHGKKKTVLETPFYPEMDFSVNCKSVN